MFGNKKRTKLKFGKSSGVRIRVLLLLGVCFAGWLAVSQAGQETLSAQYEDLAVLFGKKNTVEAAEAGRVGVVFKSPFVEKADEQKPPLPQNTGAVPVASVPGGAPLSPIILKAVIYSDEGNNVAIISLSGLEKTVTVNAVTSLGKVTEIGRDYIVVGGQILSISRKLAETS